MNFNPIPKHAPQFTSERAHYIGAQIVSTTDSETGETKLTRWLEFKIGRSKKRYMLFDKSNDDKALELLQRNKHKRLVITAYISPENKTYFAILTEFGVYARSESKNIPYRVFHPETGNPGTYELVIVD